jgi:hypothetical protein
VSFEGFLGYFTGLHLLAPDMRLDTLLRTTLIVHTCDAIMCRLFAHNNGHRKDLWTVLGFFFGIWAVAILLVLPRRAAAAPQDSATT